MVAIVGIAWVRGTGCGRSCHHACEGLGPPAGWHPGRPDPADGLSGRGAVPGMRPAYPVRAVFPRCLVAYRPVLVAARPPLGRLRGMVRALPADVLDAPGGSRRSAGWAGESTRSSASSRSPGAPRRHGTRTARGSLAEEKVTAPVNAAPYACSGGGCNRRNHRYSTPGPGELSAPACTSYRPGRRRHPVCPRRSRRA